MLAAAAVACDFVTPPGKSVVASLTTVAGDHQSGPVGQALAQPIEVQALDAAGRPLPGQSLHFAVTAGGGSVDSSGATTNDSGIALTHWTLGTTVADSETLAVSSSGSSPVTVTITAQAQAGNPAAMHPAGGDNQSAAPGAAVPDSLAVKLVDQYGNPVPGVTITWSTSSGSISPGQDQTDGSGVARAAWVLGTQAGSFSATASHAGLAPVTFSAGTSLDGSTLAKTGGDGQSAPVGAALPQPLVVQLRSPNGAAVQGATVSWATAANGGSITPTSSTTDGNGQAQATWTMPGAAGPVTATATVTGQASATFTATATAGAAASIQIVSGAQQSGVVGAKLADSLAVQLKDAAGNPVSGATVTWAILAGGTGGTMTPAQSVTNADGVASTFWSLGLKADTTHVATATAGGLPPVQFTATPLLPAALALTRTAGDSQAGQVSAALPNSLVVTVRLPAPDNRPVEGVAMSWTATDNGQAAAGTPRTLPDGTNHAHWTLGPDAGPQHASARWQNQQGQVVDSTVFTATAGLAPPTAPPSLIVTAPVNWSVARPGVRVALSCSFGGRPCNVTARIGDSVVAQAANTLDQSVSLAAYDGGNVVLALCAEDPTGTVQASCSGRTVVVESSTKLASAASAPGGTVLDANASYAVFVSDSVTALSSSFCANRVCQPGAAPALMIMALPSGTPQVVANSGTSWARVTPAGAVFWQDASGNTIEWNAGASTNLGAIGTPDVAGGYAVWTSGNAVERRNSSNGTTTLIAPAGSGPSASPNGDVWFAANATPAGAPLSSWQIFQWSGGQTAQITNDTLHDNLAPKTDGTNAAFLQRALPPGSGQALAVDAGGAVAPVTDSASTVYAMSNGWVFFYRHVSSSPDQLWARSSSGSEAQVTVFGTPSTAEAYGSSGQVIYTNNGRRYEAVPSYSTPPADVMAAHGQRVVNINGTFYVALGRTLFQVK